MKNERRQWDSKTKAKVVLEGLKGRSVGDICTEYAISQSMYYKWRDIFLANVDQPFEAGSKTKKEQKLEQENNKLRKVIGDLTIELKKKTTGKISSSIFPAAGGFGRSIGRNYQGIEIVTPFLGLQEDMGDVTE